MTPDERQIISDSHEADGALCYLLSMLFFAGGVALPLTGRIEGLWLLPVAGLLLAVANWSWARADEVRA